MTIDEYKKLQRKQKKYRNVKVIVAGLGRFDSQKEANRWCELLELEKHGVINNLKRQKRYELIPAQRDDTGETIERAVSYVADFVFTITDSGETIVEDCKGVRTRDYIIKRKLLLEKYGIRITET